MVSAASLVILALTVLLGLLMNGYQTNKVSDRLDKLDAKLDRLEANIDVKLDKLEVRLNAKIDKLDAKIDRVDAKHSDRFDRNLEAAHRDALEIMRQMTSLHERVAVVENRKAA